MMTVVTELDYKRAFKEVLTILKYVPKNDFEKIPQEVIKTLEKNQDNSFEYEIDFSVDFQEQEVSEVAKAILANFYRDYWATEKERKKIIIDEKVQRQKDEAERRAKYNPDNIFNNHNQNITVEKIEVEKDLIPVNENLFQKIINKIKLLIKR